MQAEKDDESKESVNEQNEIEVYEGNSEENSNREGVCGEFFDGKNFNGENQDEQEVKSEVIFHLASDPLSIYV